MKSFRILCCVLCTATAALDYLAHLYLASALFALAAGICLVRVANDD